MRNLLMINIVLSSCWDAHSFVVPVVGHAKGLSASSIGLVLGSFATAATVVRLAIVRWADSGGTEPLKAVLARCLLLSPDPSRLAVGVTATS